MVREGRMFLALISLRQTLPQGSFASEHKEETSLIDDMN